jgi:hypothetical protein
MHGGQYSSSRSDASTTLAVGKKGLRLKARPHSFIAQHLHPGITLDHRTELAEPGLGSEQDDSEKKMKWLEISLEPLLLFDG